MSTYKYSRYITRVSRLPWAIEPSKLVILRDLMRFRAAGNRLSDDEIQARLADETDRPATPARTEGAVAVIPVVGVIAHRADSFEASSGGTSAQRIAAYLKRAVTDDSVKSVLLEFSSPGGSAEGVPELAAQIFAARKVKPVHASINADACSAAYWWASQCAEISITPSGRSGSVGVYMLFVDESQWLEKEGIKINAISAGANKLEGSWWEEMSEETREHFQSEVDAVYRDFLAAVARGRGRTVADVKKNFGEGRAFNAEESLKRGMVDRIEPFDQTLARMLKARAGAKSGARAAVGLDLAQEPDRSSTVLVENTSNPDPASTSPATEAAQDLPAQDESTAAEQAVTPEQVDADRDYAEAALKIAELL